LQKAILAYAFGLAAFITAAQAQTVNQPLKSPIRTVTPVADGSPECNSMITPVRNVIVAAPYAGGPKDTFISQYSAALTNLEWFSGVVTTTSDKYLKDRQRSQSRCVLQNLAHWARAGALLGMNNNQGRFQIRFNAASICTSYLKIIGDDSLPAEDKTVVEKWMLDLASEVRSGLFWDTSKPERDLVRVNNHAYIAGLSAVLCAIAGSGDTSLEEWGLRQYKVGVSQITRGAILPHEAARGRRAFYYHALALTNLVFLAEIGERNGIAMFDMYNGAIHRIAEWMQNAVMDPFAASKRWGESQDTSYVSSWGAPGCRSIMTGFRIAGRPRQTSMAWS